jgi:endoglycosylceramidase
VKIAITAGVFAPHLYGGSLAAVSVDDGYRFAEQAAAQYGTTVWSGEWGWFSADPKDDEPKIRDYVAQEDAHLWGGAWWDWKQACGDPTCSAMATTRRRSRYR